MKQLLVIDDDQTTLAKVSSFLNKSGYKTVTADNAQQALGVVEKNEQLCLIIVDIMMPVMDGIEFVRRVRSDKKYNHIPIIMLTSMSDITDKYMGFDAGADDYITKPFEPLELLMRIQALIKRAAYFSEEELKKFYADSKKSRLIINEKDYSVNIDGKDVYLTAVEFDMICYLYSNAGSVVSTEDILQNVLNYPPKTGNPESVRTHIKNIRAKIEQDQSKPEIIITIPKRGYRFNLPK
ncbi:MAG: response regulator transcription factor [Candidatus Sericytochromatia bacterium]